MDLIVSVVIDRKRYDVIDRKRLVFGRRNKIQN